MDREKREVSCAFCTQKMEKEDSLKIRESFLCGQCEEKIVALSVEDADYPAFVEKIKGFWSNP